MTRRWLRSVAAGDSAFPWLAPLVAMLIVFTIYPLLYNIWLSFHEFVPRKRGFEFVGLENWARLFADARFWGSMGVTFAYFFAMLVVQVALGMAIALLLDSEQRGFGLMRALLTLTLVIPPAITGYMFLLLQDPEFGVITYLLESLGLLSHETPILTTESTALLGVMLADIWQWTPFMVLIFLAGLRSLPPEPYEAAMLDGASGWQIFRRITLPMMSKVIAIAVLIRGIDLFRAFDYIYVMTSGGPGTATYTLTYYAWQQFSAVNWGYSATICLVALMLILAMANLFIWIAKVRW